MDLEQALHDLVDDVERETAGLGELVAERLRRLDLDALLALPQDQIAAALFAEIKDLGAEIMQARGPALARAGETKARELYG